MKKSIYLASSLLIPWVMSGGPTIATQNQVPPKDHINLLFSNSRLGLGMALEFLQADIGLKIQPPFVFRYIESQQSQTGKHIQISPSIELGNTFGKDYYLGLLLSYHYSGLTSKSSGPIIQSLSFNHEFKLNYYTDLLIKGGYNINPCTTIYVLFGPTITRWSHTSRQFSGQVGQIVGNSILVNKTSVGLGIGIGFEYRFKKDYAFSINYSYHLHPAASSSKELTIRMPLGPTTDSVTKKIDLSFSTIALRFTKYFQL